jgi:hypothetical protein
MFGWISASLCSFKTNNYTTLSTALRNYEIQLSPMQRQVILGSLLGDACIEKQKPSYNPRVRWGHGMPQREYIGWKYEILKSIVSTPPHQIKNECMLSPIKMFMQLSTRSLPCLNDIYKLTGSREITQEWLDEITDPIALAVWYQDDGDLCKINKTGYCIRFSTGNRSETELNLLKSWMSKQFGIYCTIYIPKNLPTATGIKIYTQSEVRKFVDLIRPYVIPSMQYKLPKK